MTDDELIQRLKIWLDDDGNSVAKLASKMGYSSDGTIRMWILRGKIPKWRKADLTKIIGAKK